jgi:hypothetical protein
MLGVPTRARLRQQLLAPARGYHECSGRRVVESKDETKEKIGRSPDDADALLLTYLEGVVFEPATPIETPGRGCLSPSWAAHHTRRGGASSAGGNGRRRSRGGA